MNEMKKIIDIVRPVLNEDHPEWASNQLIRAANRQEAIGMHRFGYHIFTLHTAILGTNLEMLFVLDKLGPNYAMSAYLPLTPGQFETLMGHIPYEVMGGVICVRRFMDHGPCQPGAAPYLYVADMHVVLDYRNSISGFFEAVSIMQKELARFVNRYCFVSK